MECMDVSLNVKQQHEIDWTIQMHFCDPVFTHSILMNTDFIDKVTPKIKQIVNDTFNDYTAIVILNNLRNSQEEEQKQQEEVEELTHKQVLTLLGPMQRVKKNINENNEENVCGVCCSSYTPNEFIRRLPGCKHIFHKRCIDAWIFKPPYSCPTCRHSISSE